MVRLQVDAARPSAPTLHSTRRLPFTQSPNPTLVARHLWISSTVMNPREEAAIGTGGGSLKTWSLRARTAPPVALRLHCHLRARTAPPVALRLHCRLRARNCSPYLPTPASPLAPPRLAPPELTSAPPLAPPRLTSSGAHLGAVVAPPSLLVLGSAHVHILHSSTPAAPPFC
jgi:hypothetical protein